MSEKTCSESCLIIKPLTTFNNTKKSKAYIAFVIGTSSRLIITTMSENLFLNYTLTLIPLTTHNDSEKSNAWIAFVLSKKERDLIKTHKSCHNGTNILVLFSTGAIVFIYLFFSFLFLLWYG